MKKILAALLSVGILAGGAAFAACKDDTASNNKFSQLTDAKSVYGFSAASAGMLISSMNGGSAADVAAAKGVAVADAQTDIKAELDEYMALVESLLSDGGFNIISQTSDRQEYSEKMVVSYKDMHGNTLQYMMYYNQILTGSESEVDDGKVETEDKYDIQGVMVIDGVDYAIRGERENESEGDESESETQFRVTLSETDYMLVEQSYESERDESEQEYSYSLYSGRTLKERSTFEFEQERNETELKMTSYKDGVSTIVYFEKDVVLGEEVIRLRVGSGQNSKSYIVHLKTDENGKPYYEYELQSGNNYDDWD